MPINTPLDISNCKVWLDMSDLTTLSGLSAGTVEVGNFRPTTTNDLVGFVGDKSNNGNHFTNFSGLTASRPTLINNEQNGRSVLRFYGTNYLTSTFNLPITSQTVFAVASRRLFVNTGVGRVYTQSAFGEDNSATSSNLHFIPITVEGTANQNAFSSFVGGGFQANTFRMPPQLSALEVFTSALSTNLGTNGTRVFTYLGGLSSTGYFGAPTRSTFYNVTASRIGAGFGPQLTSRPTDYTYLTGDIGEIVVYDRALSREERTSVEWYLANKWNLPLAFYALSSGNWSNESIWSVSGTPLPRSDVYSNGYQINIDQNVNVRGLLGIHATPQNTASTVGTFNLTSPYNLFAPISGIQAGTSVGLFISTSGTGNITLSGNVLGGSAANSHGIAVSGIGGLLTIFGNVSGGSNASAFGTRLCTDITGLSAKNEINILGGVFGRTGAGVVNDSTSYISITGSLIIGGTGASGSGILNNTFGVININSNLLGGSNSTAYGANNVSNGVITLLGNISASSLASGAINSSTGIFRAQGNIIAHPNANGFTSSNASAINELTCNFFNASGGRQAVFANRYTVPGRINEMRTVFDNRYSVTNLLSSSELFSSPNWSQPFAPVLVSNNSNFGPTVPLDTRGTTIATNNGSSGIFAIRRHFTSVANTWYNFSVYASKHLDVFATGNLELYAITPNSVQGAVFNLTNGQTLTVSPSTFATDSGFFDSILGYRRYGITFFTSTASLTSFVEIRITTSSSLSQHISPATGNEKFYIFGAQLVQSPAMLGYVPTQTTTTATPVQTHNPALYVEEGTALTFFYDSNNYLISNLPNENDVRDGVAYGGFNTLGIVSSLTGNMIVPPRTSVKVNTLVDNTSGDAIFTVEDSLLLWRLSADAFTGNTVGARLKNIPTIFDTGNALNTMNI